MNCGIYTPRMKPEGQAEECILQLAMQAQCVIAHLYSFEILSDQLWLNVLRHNEHALHSVLLAPAQCIVAYLNTLAIVSD